MKLLFRLCFLLYAAPLLASFGLGKELTTPKVRILVGFDAADRSKYVDTLKSELQRAEQLFKDFSDSYERKLEELSVRVQELQDKAHTTVNIKKINLLTRLIQFLHDIKETREQSICILKQHIEFWEKYFAESVHQPNTLEEKSLYSFLDLQNMQRKILLQEGQLRGLLAKKEEITLAISREEYVLATKEKELESIEQSIESKKKQSDLNKEEILILDLDKEVVCKERELAMLRLSLFQKNQEFLNSKESVLQDKLQFLQDSSQTVRHRLYIDVADVYSYEQKSIEQKKVADLKKVELAKTRSDISSHKILAQEELDRLRRQFKISFNKMKQLEDVSVTVHNIVDNFAFYSVAHAYVSVVTYERLLNKIKLEMSLQDIKARHMQILSDTVKLLYEISQGRIRDSETFEKELIEYNDQQAVLESELKSNKEQIFGEQTSVKEVQNLLMHLKKQDELFKILADDVSSFHKKKWNDCSVMMTEMIKNLEEQDETLLQKNELYDQIVGCQEESLEAINCILKEFDQIGMWHRSISAVTWDGIKNILPNLSMFIKDIGRIVSSYFAQFSLSNLAFIISKISVGGLFGLILLLLFAFILYLFLQAMLPSLHSSFMSRDGGGINNYNYRFYQGIAAVFAFMLEIFTPLYAWCLLLLYTFLFKVSAGFLVLFYAFCIFLGIYVSRKILSHFIQFNRKFDYFLISKRLNERFSLIFLFFSISTIVLLVFRKMFMLVMLHQQTEFPNILLRVYHIVIWISIVFSLDKEELLQLLPQKSSLWIQLLQAIGRYYYLVLLMIFSVLVLCDPYLGGYGSLLWHLFWNIFVSLCIVGMLFLIYTIIRKYSSVLFFKEDDSLGGFSERFDYAKTWYAIYILGLMGLIAFIGVIFCADVWGYGFTYGTLRKVIMYELCKIQSTGTDKWESFRVINLLYILFMFCVGVVVAYCFRKFVLRRVFDIQYVDPGIQNTVTIISRHVIIIASVMIACIQSKLGDVVYYVSVVGLVTFGWSFKDLLTDFVAYFFILVQRPVKLGDYVKIDNETMGVVRKISSRAVILRRKNSVNIVVPNSTVLKSSLYNWNYTRGYIGLEDIVFTVPFNTNVVLVREICFKVLDEDSDVLKVPQPFVRLENFDDKGYVFMVRGFASAGNTLRQWDINSNLRFALIERLGKEGISIAGPTVKVFMNSNDNQMDY